MLSERDIELAHPDAFDFVWGNLPAAKRAEFNRHLSSCPHCQKVIDEYGEIGQVIKLLPPPVEPAADLEDRTVAAMIAALAEQPSTSDRRADVEDRAATRLYPIPKRQLPAEPKPQVQPIPQLRPPAGDDIGLVPAPVNQPAPAETAVRPIVTRLPVWRRNRRRLIGVAAIAAAVIIAVVVVLPRIGARHSGPSQALVVIPLHATTAAKVNGFGAAAGQATARQDASGSWDITLTVHHLRNFRGAKWYQCWYVSTQHRQVASAGTFLVPDSGSGTFSMTSAVDPHDFPTMEITIGPPNKTGARAGTVILSGQPL